ncbi:SDA1 domain-containing protein [Rhizoctonia solani AG-1 IA]|uniref:SDA1 domain-containing protein n=1 Tax=Thanatephorus cucumeris (strain AG1-IA) TaxID=983506 RepID=L8WS97_THACA|nr:SDA1 domain-containing protein [Rhizoctonia solani AG-1 IA]
MIARSDFNSGLSRHLKVARGTYANKDLTELEIIRLQPNPDIIEQDEDDQCDHNDDEEGEEDNGEEKNDGEGSDEQEHDDDEDNNEEVGVTVQEDDQAPSGAAHRRNCDGCGGCMAAGKHNPNHTMVAIGDPSRTPYLSKTQVLYPCRRKWPIAPWVCDSLDQGGDLTPTRIHFNVRATLKQSRQTRHTTSRDTVDPVVMMIFEGHMGKLSVMPLRYPIDEPVDQGRDSHMNLFHISKAQPAMIPQITMASQFHDSDEEISTTPPGSTKENKSRNARAQARLRARRKAYVESCFLARGGCQEVTNNC